MCGELLQSTFLIQKMTRAKSADYVMHSDLGLHCLPNFSIEGCPVAFMIAIACIYLLFSSPELKAQR